MFKKYKIIIFDLDGTITDSKMGIIKSLDYSFEKMGIMKYSEKSLCEFIGLTLEDIYKQVLQTDDKSKINQAIELYRERFERIGMYENELYMGIDKLIEKLHNNERIIAIASIKPAIYSTKILEYFKILIFFKFIVGASPDGRHDNKTNLIRIIRDYLRNNNKSEIIMIGDRRGDIEGAMNNGIDSIGVTYGYGKEDEFGDVNPTYLANSIEELWNILI